MKKNILPKLLFFYSAIAALFVALSTLSSAKSTEPVIFQLLFLPVVAYFLVESIRKIKNRNKKEEMYVSARKGGVITVSAIFILLVILGLSNISKADKTSSSFYTSPSSQKTSSESAIIFKKQEQEESKKKIKVVIKDGSEYVNVREEPSTYSKAVGRVKNNDEYFVIDQEMGWYEISLNSSGSTSSGFIHSNYIVKIEDSNQTEKTE